MSFMSFKFFCNILFFISSKLCADRLGSVSLPKRQTHVLSCEEVWETWGLFLHPNWRYGQGSTLPFPMTMGSVSPSKLSTTPSPYDEVGIFSHCRGSHLCSVSISRWTPPTAGKLVFITYFKTYTSSPSWYHDVTRVSSTLSENNRWLRAHM